MNGLENLDTISMVAGTSLTNKESLLVDLALIEEDPLNVRTVFNDLELEELIKSIKENGLKSPISIRPNPEKPDYYLVNNGARRTRAFKELGETQIPAYVDHDHDEIDQIIDNLHRVDLSPIEIAYKLDSLLKSDKGLKKDDIANRLAKSNTWVSKHLALLKLPEQVKFLFDLKRITSLDALYLLTTKWKKHGIELSKWLEQFKESSGVVSQITIQNFINTLEDKEKNTPKEKNINNDTGAKNSQNSSENYENIDSAAIGLDSEEPKEVKPEVNQKEDYTLTESPAINNDDLTFINLTISGSNEEKDKFRSALTQLIDSMKSSGLVVETV
ncbi:ParB/RepB/Spo0J family partition protein (plasmid) [Acinetobacter sp. ESL0695]|uniref:ParB/RepB/Spo0J family partition protein n=1 Tax=Acinetobacter sp. ESL0695 TaxID=2983215 RepID=UPI0023F2CA78|nr:ParB/RepB/Spo0J family partition protein [Acinetobacter sp. ESL0695]WEV50238.1 ParB/RepB/Spo0J family partition protein [Acinetobacter sp. ESL0695]